MFETILRKCMEAGLVKGESIVMDSTHIKANAANDYAESVLLTEGISEYWQKLNEEYGQTIKSKKEDADTTTTQKKTSLSDPEAGWMGRRNKPKGFHYLCNQSADVEYGIVTDVCVVPGDTVDADCCAKRVEYQKQAIGMPLLRIGLDSGYDTVQVHHELHGLDVTGYIYPHKTRSVNSKQKGNFSIEDFIYDAQQDHFVCPNGCVLHYTGVVRMHHRICKNYSAKTADCENCAMKHQCFTGKSRCKLIRRDFYKEDQERNRMLLGTGLSKYMLRKRQIICEGNFALQKRCHNMRFTRKRGIENVEEQCLFSAMALNLKRLVKYGAKQLEAAAAMATLTLGSYFLRIHRFFLPYRLLKRAFLMESVLYGY